MDSSINNNQNQRTFWEGNFGNDFVDRMSSDDIKRYEQDTGTTYRKVFQDFFQNIDRDSKILELGCNIGVNLSYLFEIGFKNLHGLEVNKKALDIGKQTHPFINFIHSSIEEFETNKKFDLVFTAGVLIHINPDILESIIKKMHSLSNQYIFGFEYFSENLVEINYRTHNQRCWKQNFLKLFKTNFPSLKILKEQKIQYLNSDLCDIVYLLRK